MATKFVDLEQVVKNWAWREYDRTATKKQRQLREKEKKKSQSYISMKLDWSEVRFHDDTVWARLANDELDGGDENENEPKQKKADEGTPAAVMATASGGSAAGTPKVSVLFHTKFTNNTKDVQEYTLRTEKTTRSTCSTSVENGFTKGVDMSINLKTPCEILEVNAGYHKEVSLTNTEGEEFEEELSWGAESVIKVKAEHVAEAQLVVNERKQAGNFTITTRIRGMVYVTFTNVKDNNALVKATGHDVSEIVEEYLKQEQRKGETMDFIEVRNNTVYITTKGSCKFRYGIRQEVQVDQRPMDHTK